MVKVGVNLWYILQRPYALSNCSVKKDVGMELCQYVDLCFHALSLSCSHTFWHAIPTSFYIFNVFLNLVLYGIQYSLVNIVGIQHPLVAMGVQYSPGGYVIH